jgi:hypothetical protein
MDPPKGKKRNKSMNILNPRILEFWNSGILEFWNSGILEFWNLESGILKFNVFVR